MSSFQSTFLAWITRMPLIKRWALMHCFREENVSEHSHQVAVIAHMLTVISNEYCGTNLDPAKSAELALFHEISETKLQDLNSKTKYQTPEFTAQFKKLEHIAETECVNTLPPELRKHYEKLIVQSETDPVYKTIVKAADTLAAYIKSREEMHYNNCEFSHVSASFEKKLQNMKGSVPGLSFFMEHFIESCGCTVDELSGIDEKNSSKIK